MTKETRKYKKWTHYKTISRKGWEDRVKEHPKIDNTFIIDGIVYFYGITKKWRFKESDTYYESKSLIDTMKQYESDEYSSEREKSLRNYIFELESKFENKKEEKKTKDLLKYKTPFTEKGEITFGKYLGQSVDTILKANPKYLHWCLYNDYCDRDKLKNLERSHFTEEQLDIINKSVNHASLIENNIH